MEIKSNETVNKTFIYNDNNFNLKNNNLNYNI